jgi:hypothetical protein
MRTFIGIWMVCTFVWKAKFTELEIPNADASRGWELYLAEYIAAAVYSLWPAVGLWLTLGRFL